MADIVTVIIYDEKPNTIVISEAGPQGTKGSDAGGLEVVNTYADIDIVTKPTPRMIAVKADETNKGASSLYFFDGVNLTQVLTP